MAEEELALVQRCLMGDVSAIQQLLSQFQTDVFGLCYRLLSHRQDAEDVTQEVFLRVVRSLSAWDSSRPLKPWILGIAVNRCKTWLAQRSRRPELVEYLHETVAAREVDDDSELLTEIQTALAEMRLEYRTVFTLFHEQGHPYEVIAVALDRPVGTIKTWLHRARQEVFERLKSRGMLPEEPATPGAAQRPLYP